MHPATPKPGLPRSISRRKAVLNRSTVFGAAIALALSAVLLAAQAQVPAMVGSLGNFDVLNNAGQETHGFEIQMEGIQSKDLTRIFGAGAPFGVSGNVIRYGTGIATDYPGGVIVRWASPWDPVTQSFPLATPVPVNRTTVPGDSCWILGMPTTYYTAGCEHFGISSIRNPTSTTYRWLVADAQNPGILIASAGPISLPPPYWTVVPPPLQQPGAAPVVVAEIVAAPPPVPQVPPPLPQYGDAQWVKIYKTENAREVQLEELFGDNAMVVPRDPAHLESAWNLIQFDPLQGQNRKGRLGNQGPLGAGSHAVVRRYEFYEYSGIYDPLTHQVRCGGDGTCAAPLVGELGDALGAQNVAANINAPAVVVTKAGNGNVDSADRFISCGSKCTAFYSMGTPVTLSAKPGSGSVFSGWGGACGGNEPTCSVMVNDALNVTAAFVVAPAPAPAPGGGGGGGGGVVAPGNFTLKVSVSNSGTITSDVGGINCGLACSATVAAGAVVVLTATPPAGKTFTGWSGACTGSANICAVTVNANLSAKANFSK